MRSDILRAHLDRRKVLGLGAAATVAAAVAPAAATPAAAEGQPGGQGQFSDAMFTPDEVAGWAERTARRYGRDDQRGTFNEINPQTTRRALDLLERGGPVRTYNLGELLSDDFPAFPSTPPRTLRQRLLVNGYQPRGEFVPVAEYDPRTHPSAGILGSPTPLGPNALSFHEERFPHSGTYQVATQLDNLGHIGVGEVYYNGNRGPDIATPRGLSRLGNENMGPVVTRAVIYDIVGLKLATGARGDLFRSPVNDEWVLRDNYRITLEDMRTALRRQGVRREPGAGDVAVFRTGWTHLLNRAGFDDPADPSNARYLAAEPGIFLREARYLADRRVAIAASDTWGLEVLDPAVTAGNLFPVHQVLIVQNGVRVGEGVRTESLVRDGVFEFVYIVTPQFHVGSTAGNTPPAGLAVTGRHI
ncbi:MAG TPA: cyclase family protein [Actinophytocola sp.]|uniref:cyclase family protein n=1 Tax=Actinophytocola sp. TaxID=1872138 RepID=UPI002DBF1E3C|nr:cyclase family protein [Actinophytocola sp.]HEU5473499.1 cyclase family protein [Actinophytocola sp.]